MKAILIGAGPRGLGYSKYALSNPQDLEIIGVAEPIEKRRERFKKKYNIPEENCFNSWEDLAKKERIADAVFICTQDQMHYEPCIAFSKKGYHILLEKPMSPSPSECMEMARVAEENDVKVVVCHVLRYSNFFVALKEIIESGEIGEVVSVIHNENVGNTHYAHSFVRGHWRNSKKSAPMILAKACHDTDIIQWLIGKKCLSVSSIGSLKYFNNKNCPTGATLRCTDGCPHGETCAYDARKLYFPNHTGYREWYARVAADSGEKAATDEEVLSALKAGPYGRCVFQCDNDVVDHQLVNMQFEDGITASFSMSAFTPETSRTIKIMGTKGQIRATMQNNIIEVTDFLTYTTRKIDISNAGGLDGHGGGDEGLVKAFCDYVNNGKKSIGISNICTTAENHMISFAAEESRISGGKVVELKCEK